MSRRFGSDKDRLTTIVKDRDKTIVKDRDKTIIKDRGKTVVKDCGRQRHNCYSTVCKTFSPDIKCASDPTSKMNR